MDCIVIRLDGIVYISRDWEVVHIDLPDLQVDVVERRNGCASCWKCEQSEETKTGALR